MSQIPSPSPPQPPEPSPNPPMPVVQRQNSIQIKCRFCGKAFTDDDELKSHVDKQHRGEQDRKITVV